MQPVILQWAVWSRHLIQIRYIFCPPLCEVEKASGTRLMAGQRLTDTARVYPFLRHVSGKNFSACNQTVMLNKHQTEKKISSRYKNQVILSF